MSAYIGRRNADPWTAPTGHLVLLHRMDAMEYSQDYNNRITVPDVDQYLDKWRAESGGLRSEAGCIEDVSYGPGSRETCDIFASDVGDKAPVMIFVHGGWWSSLDKKDFSFLARPFLKKGIVCVFVGYPLAPHAPISGIVTSVRRAMIWTKENISRFGGNPENLHLSGHSAGAHLVAAVAGTQWKRAGLKDPGIASVCAISGLFCLEDLLNVELTQKLVRLEPDEARSNSVTSIGPNPFILSVGGSEVAGFLRQHEWASTRWKSDKLTQIVLEGKNHYTAMEDLGKSESLLHQTFVEGMI